MHFIRVLLLALVPAWLNAQPMPGVPDGQIMQEARLVASSGRVDLYEHHITAPTELAQLADRAIARMETALGRRWDTARLGERVRIYVSRSTRISHVLGGYEHQRNPKAVVFLSPVVAQLALSGRNATYAHELAHLLMWRYHSHTLREGLADHLALQLHPGAGTGPNRDGYAKFPPVADGVIEFLGTSAPPPAGLLQDPLFRESYYASSYRLVHYLIGVGGLAKFLELYAARDPEPAFERLYGSDRGAIVAAALRLGAR